MKNGLESGQYTRTASEDSQDQNSAFRTDRTVQNRTRSYPIFRYVAQFNREIPSFSDRSIEHLFHSAFLLCFQSPQTPASRLPWTPFYFLYDSQCIPQLNVTKYFLHVTIDLTITHDFLVREKNPFTSSSHALQLSPLLFSQH